MKKLYFLIPALFCSGLVLAQLNEFAAGFQFSMPQGAMKNGWSTGYGLNMGYYRHLANVKGLSIGADFGYGTYAMDTQPQEYRFRDGTITNTEVNLSSSLGYAAMATRYEPLLSKMFSPFVELQGGYFGMNSNLYIEDPTDPFGCRALENRTLVKSGTAFWSPGAGLKIQLSKCKLGDIHSIEIRARYIMGGELEYANMNRIYHHQDQNSNGQEEMAKGEKPLVVTFINVTTNELHEHSVAELYKHPLRALQFNLSYNLRFSKLF